MSLLLSDDTRYVKLLLLLLKGGTYLCKKQTLKILDNDNTTIDICLKTHRDQIFNAFKKRLINPKLWELLSPDFGQPKNVDVWDISAHAHVLLNLFDKRLTASEIKAITKLREQRNDLAHQGIRSLHETKFLEEWSDLIFLLHQLSTGLTSNDKDYLNKLIHDVSAIQELDKANDELKPFEDTEDFVKEVLAEQHRSTEKRFEEFDRRISELERKVESGQSVTQERLKKSDEKAVGTMSISPLHSEDERVDMLTSYTPPVIEHKPYQRQVTQERQKKSYEKAISTVSVSRRYSKDLLTILGDKVVMSGYLYTKKKKFMRKYWDRCYGILTKEYLTICDNKKSKDSRKMYPISNFEWTLPDDKVDDEEHCFVITYEERHRKPLIFACDREVTRDTWIEHIREMIIMCKNFSADSAYASGGSISSRQVERTGMYSVIDELKITSTEDSTPYQHNLLETSEAIYDLCYIDDYKDDFENVTLRKEKVTLSNKQLDSGFIKVQQNTDETRQKATTDSKTIDPRMDTLKLPLPETSGASSDLCSVEGYKDDYENVQIIDEDVNTLIKNKVTLSNKQPDSGFMKVQQNTDKTRQKATTGSKAIDPSMDIMKLPLSERIGARNDFCSVHDGQDDNENGETIKETLRRNKVIKTAGEKTVKKCNQSTESDMEIVDSHETEEVVLRSTSNSPSNFETSRSSGDSDQIYENVTIADDSKRFKAEEYMCYDRNNKTELSQMPEGTFCVRPGRYTKQELAVTKPDGKISVFRIHEQLGCVYLSEDQQFSSLDDLINYYRQTVLPTEKYKLTLMRGLHS